MDSLHRNVSLLAVLFLLVHMLTSILDGFAQSRRSTPWFRSSAPTGPSGSASERSRSI